MEFVLDPAVLDLAKEKTGCTGDDQLGYGFLGKSGATVRNWRRGKSTPDIAVCMVLRKITHKPIEEMFVAPSTLTSAA